MKKDIFETIVIYNNRGMQYLVFIMILYPAAVKMNEKT